MRSAESAPKSSATVIFDGRCRFCRAQIDVIRRLDVGGRLTFVSLHDPSVAGRFPDLGQAQLMQRLYVVDSTGQRHGGAAALRVIARRLPLLWWAAVPLHVPGSLPLWEFLYRQVATRRYWFGRRIDCADDVCGLR
jgi:predicted DCC family thiol-disulfide oxidoreductase YuxK